MTQLLEAEADAQWCPTCPDELPGQRTLVEPELDGDHQFYECTECGYAWGYRKVGASDSCALGLPEGVRRQGAPSPSAPVVNLGMPTVRRS